MRVWRFVVEAIGIPLVSRRPQVLDGRKSDKPVAVIAGHSIDRQAAIDSAIRLVRFESSMLQDIIAMAHCDYCYH